MGSCSSNQNSIQKYNTHVDNFRKIGAAIDCKHKNGRWYSAKVKMYLNCKPTPILIRYQLYENVKYDDHEWMFIKDDIICNCTRQCQNSHHRLAPKNTQVSMNSNSSSLSTKFHYHLRIDASLSGDSPNNKKSPYSPSSPITPTILSAYQLNTVILKRGQDEQSIILQYLDKSARISLNDMILSSSAAESQKQCLGIMRKEMMIKKEISLDLL